jgi:beta-glucosidase
VKEAKVGAIMDSYNLVNGIHMTQNDYLNNQILKKEWGFRGILMSDWDSTYDGVAAANAGLDLEMPTGRFMNPQTLVTAVKEGRVSVATIDDKVRRILRTAVEFGFFDSPQKDTSIPAYSQPGRELALQEARGSMVLLKNSGSLLPLDKSKVKTIAVLGPDSYPAVPGGGGSSQTTPFNAVSFLEGISNYLGTKANVLYAVDNPPLDEVFQRQQFVTAPGGEPGLKGNISITRTWKAHQRSFAPIGWSRLTGEKEAMLPMGRSIIFRRAGPAISFPRLATTTSSIPQPMMGFGSLSMMSK